MRHEHARRAFAALASLVLGSLTPCCAPACLAKARGRPDDRFWHDADFPACPLFGRYRGRSGHWV